ncbi:4-hydroxy-tetrahydrodipicolinate synthase [Flexivirga oryzae]|uniref:4-hydroxy-tetrahydrodipicolinate synthase n=1 Tax=Flexivirga oryzae TaxID=1794944 RepID=A0A839N0Y6_9MICO|nr:4-hydroxy-tetrahydrodipicolinate synthase [Flexivirga oryzae]MBB2890479.1 4-hydroxy-tetrahydrodipicolinate synthase [Flexivirga oryzae]
MTNPFGRMLTAMVTPMHDDGSLDLDGAQKLADHLVQHGHDGILVNGTTGESATTTDEENVATVRAVVEAVGDRVPVMAGVGTNDTAHSVAAAKAMVAAGARAALVVTPYYNKPPQAGIVEHVRAVAEAADVPVMLYDIPGRTGTALAPDTLLRLAEIPQVRAVKDAKADLYTSSKVMAQTDLLWFSGDDVLALPWLSIGAVGHVAVTGHVAGDQFAAMIKAVDAGDLATARDIHRQLIPAMDAIMTITQGAIMAKAALKQLGVIESDFCRLPLLPATPEQHEIVRRALEESHLS